MFRLGKPLEMAGIKEGKLVQFGGFVFRVPFKFNHVEAVQFDNEIAVYAYDINIGCSEYLGTFESADGDIENSRIEITKSNTIPRYLWNSKNESKTN